MELYGDAHAAWYDVLYDAAGKDHAAEAAALLARVTHALGRTPQSWLDVACGTGRHLEAVAGTVPEVVGLDLSAAMLDVARARLGPRVELDVGDQRSFDLGRTFEVVTSLFSSVAYAESLDEFDATIERMAAHVAPGGLLVIEPFLDPDAWEDNRTQVVDAEDAVGRVVRVLASRRDGQRAIFDFVIVSVAGGRISVTREEHHLLLVPRERYLEQMQRHGLDVSAEQGGPSGRGLLVGRREV